MHETFDLDHWLALFPLAELRARADALGRRWRVRAEGITGPREVAVVDQLRAESANFLSQFRQVPVDLFVWAIGEPVNRAATKAGGLPYRSKSRPWPLDQHGQPKSFAGQICFAESKDLVGDLPGDVLLVFSDEFLEHEGLTFEWQDLGLTNLMDRDDLPSLPHDLTPCYGVRLRSHEYVVPEPPFEGYLEQRDKVRDQIDLAVYEGTKIGGAPFWVQGDPELPGRYICQLGSICPSYHEPWPFVNQAAPTDNLAGGYLIWGDVGALTIYLDEHGRILPEIQYY